MSGTGYQGNGWDPIPELVDHLGVALDADPARFVELLDGDDILSLNSRDLSLAVDALADTFFDFDGELLEPAGLAWQTATLGLVDMLSNGKPVASLVRAEPGERLSVSALIVVDDNQTGRRTAGLVCAGRHAEAHMPSSTYRFVEGFIIGVSTLDEAPFICGTIIATEPEPLPVAESIPEHLHTPVGRVMPTHPVRAIADAAVTHHLLRGGDAGVVERFDPPAPPDPSWRACAACVAVNPVAIGGPAPFDMPYYATDHAQTHLSAGRVEACVDAGLAPMLEAIWAAGFATHAGCEGDLDDDHEGYVSFRDPGALEQLLERLDWRPVNGKDDRRIVELGDMFVEVDRVALRWEPTHTQALTHLIVTALTQ